MIRVSLLHLLAAIAWFSAAVWLAASSVPAAAQSVANFYSGKTLVINVGFTAGGGYDLHARTLGRFLGKHIPGNPTVVVKNVPGAAGLTLVNSLYNSLARDGTEIATFDRALPLEPLTNPERARFDALKLNWIGSTDDDVSTCFAWHTAQVKTFDDLLQHELIVGGTGTGGDAHAYPILSYSTQCWGPNSGSFPVIQGPHRSCWRSNGAKLKAFVQWGLSHWNSRGRNGSKTTASTS
jgi:hypothetical protein